MQMKPIPPNPTLADALGAVTQVHECLEDLKSGDIQDIKADMRLMKRALGLEGVHPSEIEAHSKPAGLVSQWKAFRRNVQASATSIIGLFFVYKFAVFMAPSLWAVVLALSRFALSR